MDVRGIRYPGLISWKSPVSGGTTDYAVDIFHAALSEKSTYDCFLNAQTRLPMMYMDDAIRATISLMDEPIESLSSSRCGYNISGVSFTPEELVFEINKKLPNFVCSEKKNTQNAFICMQTKRLLLQLQNLYVELFVPIDLKHSY